MKITTTTYTVADYCEMLRRLDVRVNRDYQRSERVWPDTAKSFLIDTILLGFPIPKLSLYQTRDSVSGKVFRDIVDGQQRSEAVLDFFEGRLRLGKNIDTEEAKGHTFAELSDELQLQFLEYALSADLFLSATQEEIRDVFRRINSYTVPLNPEEQRHAKYQGAFKWFIFELTRKYDHAWLSIGTFSEKQLVRMADAKLLTEVIHALFHGISTTNRGKLEQIYLDKDRGFPEADEIANRLSASIEFLVRLVAIHGTPLVSPHNVYALLLAITHLQHSVPRLEPLYEVPRARRLKLGVAQQNLSALAEALSRGRDSDHDQLINNRHRRFDPLDSFVLASETKTNVKSQREMRFQWFCAAIDGAFPLENES